MIRKISDHSAGDLISKDAPESINNAPYEAWFIKVEGVSDREELMDEAAYQAYLETVED